MDKGHNVDLRRTEKLIRRSRAFSLIRKGSLFGRLSRWLSTIIIVLLVTVLFVRWQQTATGYGKVMALSPSARVQSVSANIEGRIRKWLVREGQRVEANELIAEITDNDPEILKRIKQEREAVQQGLKVIEVSIDAAESNLNRQKELLKEGIASQRAYELAKMDHAKFLNERAKAEVDLARIDVRLARQNMQEVRAPITGYIQKILVGENSEFLKAGDLIAMMVPESSDRIVELLLSGNDLPFIRIGQKVQLQFDGWPILQFSGLPQVSVGTFSGVIKVIDPADDGSGKFRILVGQQEQDVWPSPKILRQGVKAKGWVQMNRVPLWFEIWRNLNSLPPMTVPLEEDSAKKPDSVKSK